MSVSAPNFVLISELQMLNRRDFPLVAGDTHLTPTDSNPYLDGEWLTLTSASSYTLQRGSGGLVAGDSNEGITPSWVVHTEKGRYDTQALQKINVLYMGMYEAETVVCDSTGLAIGDSLTVQDVTVGGLTRRGLKKVVATSGSGVFVVGNVTKTYGSLGAGGKIRFIHFGYQKLF